VLVGFRIAENSTLCRHIRSSGWLSGFTLSLFLVTHVPQDARLSLGPHWTEQSCAEFNAELVRHIFAHPAPVKVFASTVGGVQYQTCSSKAQYGNVLRAAKYYFHILPVSVLILLSHDYHDY